MRFCMCTLDEKKPQKKKTDRLNPLISCTSIVFSHPETTKNNNPFYSVKQKHKKNLNLLNLKEKKIKLSHQFALQYDMTNTQDFLCFNPYNKPHPRVKELFNKKRTTKNDFAEQILEKKRTDGWRVYVCHRVVKNTNSKKKKQQKTTDLKKKNSNYTKKIANKKRGCAILFTAIS